MEPLNKTQAHMNPTLRLVDRAVSEVLLGEEATQLCLHTTNAEEATLTRMHTVPNLRTEKEMLSNLRSANTTAGTRLDLVFIMRGIL